MKRLLIGVDGSPESMAALAWSASLAAGLDATVVAAHVYAADPADRASWDDAHARAGERLEGWCEPTRAAGVAVEPALLDGEVGPALLAAADEHDADLVVVSRRGAGGRGWVMVGSAANYVAHHCHRPVAVLPAAVPAAAPTQLLLALDGSEGAQAAARWCAEVAPLLHAQLRAIYVLPVPDFATTAPRSQRDRAARSLERWCAPLNNLGVVVEREVAVDRHPVEAIGAAVQECAAGLVVVGTRAVGGLRRVRLGGVTMQLVHGADRPLVIVPPPR